MCKGSQQCQSKHKAASTACFHISMLASPRRRWNIALLRCTVGLCQCQPCSTYIPAIQTQGQLGNCLCEGHGTRKGTTMQTLRSYRAPQEALRPGEGYTRICTDNSSSSSWSWSSTTSASQWTPLTRGKKRSMKLWPPGIWGSQRWCPVSTRFICWRPELSAVAGVRQSSTHETGTGPDAIPSQPQSRTISLWLSPCHPLSVETMSLAYLRQENVPNSAPAAMPTAKPIMKPIFILSKQLGCDCPYGPTVTGI